MNMARAGRLPLLAIFPGIFMAILFSGFNAHASARLIMPGDVLRITVEESPDLNGLYPVAGDGSIDFKYCGRLIIDELTTDQAAKKIKDILERSYFIKATVQVVVSEFVEGSLLVLGAVNNPGRIPYQGDELITVLEAIVSAGGMTSRAARDQVKIFRRKPGGGTERETITVDLKAMMSEMDFSRDQYLRPRDIVVVPEMGAEYGAREYLALGEFGSAGFHPHTDGLDMIRAVVQAGGPTREAQLELGRILRPDTAGSYSMIPVDLARLFGGADMRMNVAVMPGDIIFLPTSGMTAGGKVYFLGEVTTPGMFPLSVSGDSTLARTILQRGGLTKFSNSKAIKVLRKSPDGSQQTLTFDVENIFRTGQFDRDIPLQDEDVIIIPARGVLDIF